MFFEVSKVTCAYPTVKCGVTIKTSSQSKAKAAKPAWNLRLAILMAAKLSARQDNVPEVIDGAKCLEIWQAFNQRVAHVRQEKHSHEAEYPSLSGIEVILEPFVVRHRLRK